MKKYLFFFLTLVLFAACKDNGSTTSSTTAVQEPTTTTTPSETAPESNAPESTAPTKKLSEPVAISEMPTKGSQITISGKISGGMPGDRVEVYQIPYNNSSQPKFLGKTALDGDGAYSIKMTQPGVGVYALKAGPNQALFILMGDEKKIGLSSSMTGIKKLDVQITGSDVSKRYYDLMQSVVARKIAPKDLAKKLQAEKNPLMASLIGLQILNNAQFEKVHQQIGKRLHAVKGLDRQLYINAYDSFVNKMASVIRVGKMAPDLSFPDPTGKIRNLSDLRGKLVLLDFWASWCSPCRRANPEVVAIYNKYKSKGFTVFSVSLDGDSKGNNSPGVTKMHHDRWVAAIEKDGLIWPNHVSDLKGWQSAASAVYGVQSIPQTFLIGRDGKIVAINPRNNLEETIKKFL